MKVSVLKLETLELVIELIYDDADSILDYCSGISKMCPIDIDNKEFWDDLSFALDEVDTSLYYYGVPNEILTNIARIQMTVSNIFNKFDQLTEKSKRSIIYQAELWEDMISLMSLISKRIESLYRLEKIM